MVNDPNIYVTEDFVSFRIGTKEEAEKFGWISMPKARKQFKSEEDFIAAVAKITLFDSEEVKTVCQGKDSLAWNLFEQKAEHTHVLIYSKNFFGRYVKHVLRKFIKNGYQRV